MATLRKAHQAALAPGTIWRLEASLNGHARSGGAGLATQVASGRHLRVLTGTEGKRLRVRLLEDGYPCWIEGEALLAHGRPAAAPCLPRLDRSMVERRLGLVLSFAQKAMAQPNTYLWGGTLGPDYDCSGLVQSAYAAAGIWLPRDAYLQERFCRPVAVRPGCYSLLQPGDLIFFGTPQRCTHVALHQGNGRYLHSSGRQHGRNGIGIDDLHPGNLDPVACHYRAELRGAGRVMHSHDGSPLPD
jgi:hypothetical protein